MREFITKVSDYLNERRNNPDMREDRLAIVIIGAAAAAVIVLLLLIVWGYTAGGRGQKDAQNAEGNTPGSATYKEEQAEYMAQDDGQEALRQEYLTDINYLGGKVEELLTTLTQVEQNLSKTVEQYREGDTVLEEKISSLHTEVTTIVQNLKETQIKLSDLTDLVQIINEETIPMIRGQIADIQGDIDKVHIDIADLYTKIAALEQEDAKLWASIANVENIIGSLSVRTLQYRYDAEENTLYLEPGRK